VKDGDDRDWSVDREGAAETAPSATAETVLHGVLVETSRRGYIPVQLLPRLFSVGIRHGTTASNCHSCRVSQFCVYNKFHEKIIYEYHSRRSCKNKVAIV